MKVTNIHNTIFLIVFTFISVVISAQSTNGFTQSGQPTHQLPFPITSYKELPNPVPTHNDLWKGKSKTYISWGSTDIRYKKEEPAKTTRATTSKTLTAWRGERVSAKVVISNNGKKREFSYSVSDLIKNKTEKIASKNIFTGFVRYVMTDELNKDKKGACGYRRFADYDSLLVADVIDHHSKKLAIASLSTQSIWVRVAVPEDTKAGTYKGVVSIKADNKVLKKLNLTLKVKNRVLPNPKKWAFHLDLWQNPFAIARYHQVVPWSKEHIKAMQNEMKSYADAGGKVITASIMHKPWNGQTHDYFETMVTWIKRVDGSWLFDYTVFDKWVAFMMDMGVDKQINCYSMVPWRLSFQYYDQASNSLKFIETKPGEKKYEEIWVAMLSSFAKHLKEKGWFEKTFIAMDERPMETMKETLKVIKKADKNFKISFAGVMYPELMEDIDDYCIASRMSFSEKTLKKRRAKGNVSTYYTCCEEPYPNTFTFSPPAESEWLGWYAASANLDGYLRWALNSWTLEPLLDSRFVSWAAGDTYLVYPGGRTSVRFERLVEGIQAYEKIRILKLEFEKSNDIKNTRKLHKALILFDLKSLPKTPAANMVNKAKKIVNRL